MDGCSGKAWKSMGHCPDAFLFSKGQLSPIATINAASCVMLKYLFRNNGFKNETFP